MASAKDVLRIAANEIGYQVGNDPQKGSKYGRWYAQKMNSSYYSNTGVPYCAMFVSWVLDQAGQSMAGFPGAYCPTIKQLGIKAGRQVNKYNAQAGDIVLFDWGGDGVVDHVGIVEANKGTYIQTCEGNTASGQSGSQSNGGGVWRRTRNWAYVNTVLRPIYGASSNTSSNYNVNNSGTFSIDGVWGPATTRKLQQALGTYVDGIISAQPSENKKYLAGCETSSWQFTNNYGGGSSCIAALQQLIGATPDGWFGPNSVKALQRYLGTTVDGELSNPSDCIKALQKALQNGTLKKKTMQTVLVTANIDVDGWWGKNTISALQKQLGGTVDGVVSGQYKADAKYVPRAGDGWEWLQKNAGGSNMIGRLQKKVGANNDGFVGQNTIKALQKFLGITQDGYCGPDTVKALQKAINAGKFK